MLPFGAFSKNFYFQIYAAARQKEIVIMANASRFKMSQERLDALKEELYYLETVREHGDK